MAIALYCLMIPIESCSSFALVDVWNDPSYHKSPLKKILIIAIIKDSVQRRIWEDAFVGELSKHGVNATSSYHLFPDALSDKNQVVETVQEKGFDGILVTRLLHKERETHYVESSVTTEQLLRYNIFRKNYDVYYYNIQHPGCVESQIIDRRAIDIWAIMNEERMIWSATSNSPERNSIGAVQNDIADLVIPELARNTIIKSER
ncbi:MAG: hypothetical protein M0P61_04025 [Ignavibacteriaceae bacterium]|jgi:hypothetical protein|nr:hypothetical protein [Ignavibacteriaceae bacterium]